jgi:hypothetical protein
MQAIVTKYLPATNTRGSRIKATGWAASVTVGYDYRLGSTGNHKAAVQALCDKLNAESGFGAWAIESGGEMPDGRGYAFIIAKVAAA